MDGEDGVEGELGGPRIPEESHGGRSPGNMYDTDTDPVRRACREGVGRLRRSWKGKGERTVEESLREGTGVDLVRDTCKGSWSVEERSRRVHRRKH